MAGYVNISPKIGAVVSNHLASLYELQTLYDYEDLYDFEEMIIIKIANDQTVRKRIEERRK